MIQNNNRLAPVRFFISWAGVFLFLEFFQADVLLHIHYQKILIIKQQKMTYIKKNT